MLTSSNNVIQEELVQRWLDKLTPKQKSLVTEVLENPHKHRKPTQAAISLADLVATNSARTAATCLFTQTDSKLSA